MVPGDTSPVFAEQMFTSASPARREFFSWTTDEQAAAIRKDQVLFTQLERPGLGRGYAFAALGQIAAGGVADQSQLAAVLDGALFEKGRYAWLEPWATRMGWPGEDYGGNLLRIVLRPEAWVAIVKGGTLSVVDLDNQPVALADALAHPERLGAIFYWRDGANGGPNCQGGSFTSGSNGYREFIVGNLAMVEEWSIGTQQIRDRLSANIDQLVQFLAQVRSCPVVVDPDAWNRQVVCAWDEQVQVPDHRLAYENALAIPSANYLPDPAQIATMISTLQADLFEPDPLLFTPGSP